MESEAKGDEGSTGFKVTDKRHFSREGELLEGQEGPGTGGQGNAEPPPPPEPREERKAPPRAAGPDRESAAPPAGGRPGEAVDFTHLLMSLAGSAYHSLGVTDPVTGEKGIVNLQAASQMIDLLAILQEKTRGNLTPKEEMILQNLLSELRSLFVQASSFGR